MDLEVLNARIKEIQEKYQPQLDALAEEAEQLKDKYDEGNFVEELTRRQLKIEWVDFEISWDIPYWSDQVNTVEYQVPVLDARREKITVEHPDICQVKTKIGERPEFRGLFKPPKMKPIYIYRPEPCLRKVVFEYDIPYVRMDSRTFKYPAPKVAMHRESIVLQKPRITLVDKDKLAKEIDTAGKRLGEKAKALAEAMKAEIDVEIQAYQASLQSTADDAVESVGSAFDETLVQLQGDIQALQSRQVDPIKVPTSSGDLNLRKKYQTLVAEKEQQVRAVEAALAPAPIKAQGGFTE